MNWDSDFEFVDNLGGLDGSSELRGEFTGPKPSSNSSSLCDLLIST